MNVTQLFSQINWSFRGTDDDPPVFGSTDSDMWLGTVNRKIREFATDPDVKWQSLFENRSIGTVSTTLTYDLDDDFFAPSDEVIITTTSNQQIKYTVVKPQDRGTVPRSVYVSGHDPQVLTFYDTIASDAPIIGGILSVPGYFIPDELTKANDTIPVDDPYWLVYAVASELAFNDLTYESKAADLVAKANNAWDKMVKRNLQGTAGNPRVARYNLQRIPGSNR